MGKRVTLLRHAKAVPGEEYGSDAARPLAERGRRDGVRIGAWMQASGIQPDLVLCSTSVRTRETLALVLPALPADIATQFDDALYLAESTSILTRMRALPAAVRHVLVIGHNPGLHELAVVLCGSGVRGMRAALAEKFPTCACADISFEAAAWTDVAPKGGTLDRFMTPRALAG